MSRSQSLIVRDKICGLREIVHDLDIPSPTVPEYVELHNGMQQIIKYINEIVLPEVLKLTEGEN